MKKVLLVALATLTMLSCQKEDIQVCNEVKTFKYYWGYVFTDYPNGRSLLTNPSKLEAEEGYEVGDVIDLTNNSSHYPTGFLVEEIRYSTNNVCWYE